MASVDLSVIIPIKNNSRQLSDLIGSLAEELCDLEAEFIIIDMNSSDDSVIRALDEIKRQKLRGCVIQSGGGSISSALNTGIYKSDGKYLTFVYPNRRYKKYIPSYLALAEANASDFVFSVSPQQNALSGADVFKKPGTDRVDSLSLLTGLINGKAFFDFTAVMLKREYLLLHHIKFYEDCNYGYIEAFVYNVLLHDPQISCTEMNLTRISDGTTVRDNALENVNCYERIEAMLKVFETIKLQRRDNLALTELFEYQKLPSVVMAVVDLLLKQGFSHSAIKKSLKQKGYSSLLRMSGHTSPELRSKIIRWTFIPWKYSA